MRSPLNITTKSELDNASDISRSSSFKNTNVFYGPKQIGPFALKYSSKIYNLQKGVIGMYIFVIMLSAFLGPKTLFITMWRMSTVLLSYNVTAHLLGWKTDAQSDILLAPMLYVARLVQNVLCDAID